MKLNIAWMAVGFLMVAAGAQVQAHAPLSASGDGHDTVPVLVNGRGPYPFILDTGADGTAIYHWFAERAHLKIAPGGGEALSGQTGTAQVAMYRIGDLALDGHRIGNVDTVGLPDRHDAGREAGVLGNDFMDGALVTFDFPCRKVEVREKPFDLTRVVGLGSPPVLAGTLKGSTLLTFPISVNGFAGIAILDTGSRNTRLTSSFARAAGVDLASLQLRDGAPIYGANSKKMVPREGPLGVIRFGGVQFANTRVQIIDLPMLEESFGGKPAMLLGADLLSRYRLIYDHADRQFWIRPSTCKVSN